MIYSSVESQKEEAIFVAVKCTVYNHEPYLRDCFEGFVMQKTNFHFIVVAHDDASTDGSAAIIREYAEKYPEIFHPIYETENQYSKHDGSLTRIMNDACIGAKYIASCEGDDYWTDPLKLQKQVDFLESHPEYDMVCTRFKHLIHETGEIYDYDLYDKVMPSNVDGMELKQEHFIKFAQPHPCTVMYRSGSLEDNPVLAKLKYRFDIPNYYVFLYNHRIWLMNEKTAIYRKHEGSMTTMGETERWSIIGAYKELLSFFPEDKVLQIIVYKRDKSSVIICARDINYTAKELMCQLRTVMKKHHPNLKESVKLIGKVLLIRFKLYILNLKR